MVTRRPANERGHANYGWLDTNHTFSFAHYHDPRQMGFRSLCVINEDRVQPGAGFEAHPHRDMEIISYVLEGELEHKDSLGNGSVIRAGEVQRMSAGTGIVHSEFNPSTTRATHFFQIWIEPDSNGLTPGYEQKVLDPEMLKGKLHLVAAPADSPGADSPGAESSDADFSDADSSDNRQGAVTIHQDVKLYAARLAEGDEVRHTLLPGRHGWLQMAAGAITLNGSSLADSGGAAISDESELIIRAGRETQLLLFDLA